MAFMVLSSHQEIRVERKLTDYPAKELWLALWQKFWNHFIQQGRGQAIRPGS
jgi:hypothetical protein